MRHEKKKMSCKNMKMTKEMKHEKEEEKKEMSNSKLAKKGPKK